ncbi:MAG TPA: hypothetical protein VMM27_02230 [Casimicrobiaceae bacterium]|nr:hypothetical protein [Casimicrobiaceae bacterium]
MSAEWQGDHKLLDASGEKQDFERALTQLGLDSSKFLVEVRPDSTGANCDIYVTDLEHPDRETSKLRGGPGENWVAQFVKGRRR